MYGTEVILVFFYYVRFTGRHIQGRALSFEVVKLDIIHYSFAAKCTSPVGSGHPQRAYVSLSPNSDEVKNGLLSIINGFETTVGMYF